MGFLGLGERDGDLGEPVLEVHLEWDDGETLLRRGAEEFANLAFVKQQFAGTGRWRIVVAARPIVRDRHSLEPNLAAANVRVRFVQTHLAIAQRLDLSAGEDEAGLPGFEEVVIVTGPRIS